MLFVRVEPRLMRKLDSFVEQQRKLQRGVALSRADVVRTILWDRLGEQEQAAGATIPSKEDSSS